MDTKNVSTKKGWVTVDGNLVVAECKIPGLVGRGGRSVLLLALMSIARKDNEEGRIVTRIVTNHSWCGRIVRKDSEERRGP